MATFLLKTEPSEYSYADLVREKRAVWSGVANAAARLAMRSARKGDAALIYHTGDQKALVGLAEVVKDPYPDPDAPGDEKAVVFDVKPVRAARSPVTLAAIKADRRFGALALVKQPRLSVMVVPEDLARLLREMAGL
ncbi:MAG: EVE domain-containing protein [Phycisphaerales bacterium]|nr:EVE domain-containing protein [Phycisphaerales bacterium]